MQNHITSIFIKMMSHYLLVQMAYWGGGGRGKTLARGMKKTFEISFFLFFKKKKNNNNK